MATATVETSLMKAGAQPSLIKKLANRYGLEEGKFYNTVISVVWPTREKDGKTIAPSPEMVAAFLMVCDEYDLNPFLREIYPFIDKGGNLKVIVGVDGWIKAVQRHPQYDGHTFKSHFDSDQKLVAITCSISRKDRNHPIEMTEYMHECKRETDPWKQWPARMLTHKSYIQTARYAFGLSGIVDEDEVDRAQVISVRPLEEPRRLSETASAPTSESGVPRAQIPQGDVMEQQPETGEGLLDETDIKKLNAAIYSAGLSKVDFNSWLKAKHGVDRVQAIHKKDMRAIIEQIPSIKF
jgi:phage recombination protein Bet